jgi:hypothetical protein
VPIEDPELDIVACRDEAESLSRSFENLSHALDAVIEETSAQTTSDVPTKLSACSQGSICLLKIYSDLSRLALSRLFIDAASAARPEGSASGNNARFPMLSRDVANARILRSLCMLEERLLHKAPPTGPNETSPTVDTASKVGLESILYFPALTVIALEVRCIELRRRVKVLFHAIQARGFVVAKTGLEDFELAWSATASGCGDFCFCGQTI